MIIFENNGEIDSRSIYTFGISVKESENPIGFFGTGLKYAISVLLRTGHKITIFSGLEVIEFSIKRDSIRGKDFEFIQMQVDDNSPFEIGFTTELGKTWDLWMAYRELACNTKDESGDAFYYDSRHSTYDPVPEAGKTKILVTGEAFESVFASRGNYLLEDQPDMHLGSMEVRLRPSTAYFYRGVRVMDLQQTIYTYNDTQKIDLTEDRTVKYQWYVPERIAKALLVCEDEQMIRSVVLAKQGYFEHDLDFLGRGIKPSEQFLKVVGELRTDKMCDINQSAVKVWSESTKEHTLPKEIVMTNVQKKQLEKALDFCSYIGFEVRTYPVRVVESLGTGVLGLADRTSNVIYLAERTFHLGGTKQVASALIEEYIHLKHGLNDMTRELQSYLFDKIVSMGEEMQGEPL